MRLRGLSVIKGSEGMFFLLCLLTSSLCLNVALGWKLKQAGAAAQRQQIRPGGIQANALLPPIPAIDESGNPATVSFAGPRTSVLYVWSPQCGWCKLNYANIRALSLAAGGRFRFVGLSVDGKGLRKYLRANPLPFPVFVVGSRDLISKLGFNATPQTAVVLPGGLVDRVWVGAFDQTRKEQVEEFFNVKLPGLERTVSHE